MFTSFLNKSGLRTCSQSARFAFRNAGSQWRCVQVSAAVSGKPQATKKKQKKKPQKGPPPKASPVLPQIPPKAFDKHPDGVLSPLHYNILDFCSRVVPTTEEQLFKNQIIELTRGTVLASLPDRKRVEVQVFGSFASGLSAWSSDVDLVVTGVMTPDKATGGYAPEDQVRVARKLRVLSKALQQCKALAKPKITLIPRARIPIIKMRAHSVNVDISISNDTGVKVAEFLTQQVQAYPPLKPLVLVLKTYLASIRLNDVAQGGLSSYSLCNMVIAHMQEEAKSGHGLFDLGQSLRAFLRRYGDSFDCTSQAVCATKGGIVSKKVVAAAAKASWRPSKPSRSRKSEPPTDRLCVICPLTGRDVSSGTRDIAAVTKAWQKASHLLDEQAQDRQAGVNQLAALMDVKRLVTREPLPALPNLDKLDQLNKDKKPAQPAKPTQPANPAKPDEAAKQVKAAKQAKAAEAAKQAEAAKKDEAAKQAKAAEAAKAPKAAKQAKAAEPAKPAMPDGAVSQGTGHGRRLSLGSAAGRIKRRRSLVLRPSSQDALMRS